MIDPRVASGLRDIPPAVMIPRERMLDRFRATFCSFGYVPIETPHIERLEVLTGKGAGSDEVLRQIFNVTNTGGTPGELGLRFDLTVPLARFVGKHVNEIGIPFKRYAIGSVFRGERPAKGRFREFVQCDFDIVGTTSPIADAEIIQVIHGALSAAEVPPFTIAVNDLTVLSSFFGKVGIADQASVLRSIDKLAKIGREGVLKELLGKSKVDDEAKPPIVDEMQAREVLDFIEEGRSLASHSEVLNFVDKKLGKPTDLDQVSHLQRMGTETTRSNLLLEKASSYLEKLLELLTAGGVPESSVKVDLGLARGLDYYTGIVFETTVDGSEAFGSICSGGRYNDLASLFTNRRLPGVGASIGLDRLIALMEEKGLLGKTTTTAKVLVANFPGTESKIAVDLGSRLRRAGISADVFPDPDPVGKQMGYGSARGHRLGVIVGPDEAAKQVFNLRNLATRQEEKAIPWSDLEAAVGRALAGLEGGAR